MAIDRKIPGKSFLNYAEYRDKVLGCWTGKNIGGTLGTPMECQQQVWDIDFYTQDLKGNPLLLFAHAWSIKTVLERNKGLELLEFSKN